MVPESAGLGENHPDRIGSGHHRCGGSGHPGRRRCESSHHRYCSGDCDSCGSRDRSHSSRDIWLDPPWRCLPILGRTRARCALRTWHARRHFPGSSFRSVPRGLDHRDGVALADGESGSGLGVADGNGLALACGSSRSGVGMADGNRVALVGEPGVSDLGAVPLAIRAISGGSSDVSVVHNHRPVSALGARLSRNSAWDPSTSLCRLRHRKGWHSGPLAGRWSCRPAGLFP